MAMTDSVPQTAEAHRFYDDVTVVEEEGGFSIQLDDRPLHTPRRARMVVPGEDLAVAIAEEWLVQSDRIVPDTMPLTRIANSAIDQVANARDIVIADIAAYASSDLVCYRAEGPEALVARQSEHWDPILAWSATSLDATFRLAGGVVHVEQSGASLARVRAALEVHDSFALAALHVVTTLTGSALLALALADRHLDAGAVWAAAHVDEDWQISQWGEDAEAASVRAARHRDFAAAARVLDLRPT